MYPLRKSTILDLGLNVDIVNEKCRLRRYRRALPGEYIWAGDSKAPVLGYGDITIIVNIPEEEREEGDTIRPDT